MLADWEFIKKLSENCHVTHAIYLGLYLKFTYNIDVRERQIPRLWDEIFYTVR